MIVDKKYGHARAQVERSQRDDQHTDPKAPAQIPDPSFRHALRSASVTRQMAIALDRNPIPELTKSDLETRWQVGLNRPGFTGG